MRRHRLLATLAALALLVGFVPNALADDPAADKAKVEAQLARVQGEVLESTAAVAAAARALAEVDAQLATARDQLAAARADLDVAEAEDARLAAALSAARDDESVAEADLSAAQVDIKTNEDSMGALARAAYQGGSIQQFNAIFDAGSLTEFSQRVEGMQTALRAQDAVLYDLANDRAGLAVRQATLEAARERVATARAEAAAVVVEKTRLAAVAADAAAQVEALHGQRAEVLAGAQSALAQDEAEYAALQVERKRLEDELQRRAAAAAAAAAAAGQSSGSSYSSSGVLYRPVLGPVTSSYGMRVHPITGIYKLHDGTDFGASCGTPIRAAASGTVLRRGDAGGYGNQTVIEHGVVNGVSLATSYSHQSRFAVSVGQRVQRGQIIGYAGTTGYSTGCHLHFMVYANGRTTNPMNYL